MEKSEVIVVDVEAIFNAENIFKKDKKTFKELINDGEKPYVIVEKLSDGKYNIKIEFKDGK